MCTEQLFRKVCLTLCTIFIVAACSDNSTPSKLEEFTYGSAPTTAHCGSGIRNGRAGAINDETTPEGIRYNVRTPSNYDPTVGHPVLIVYAPAGQSRWLSERFTGLTPSATSSGFVVVYADHRPLGIPAIGQLGAISGLVAKKWCIDEKRVYITGHSDGGTVSLALALLDRTKQLPAGIAPSAAGWSEKDLESYQCRAPIPVIIMHSANDRLFPGRGIETASWWASCNRCDLTKAKQVEGSCTVYQECAPGGATLYCEGTGSHQEWPGLNQVMLEFFTDSEKFP